mgnify:CR=1 FL=1
MSEHEGLLKMDGYDDCIVGIVERFGQDSYFIYDKEEVLVAEVQKRFSFRPKFTVQALNNEMVVEGSLFGHNFSVMNNGELVAAISKKVFSFGDSYEIEIIPNENKELYLFLVIVIDQVIHESKKNGGSYNG